MAFPSYALSYGRLPAKIRRTRLELIGTHEFEVCVGPPSAQTSAALASLDVRPRVRTCRTSTFARFR